MIIIELPPKSARRFIIYNREASQLVNQNFKCQIVKLM